MRNECCGCLGKVERHPIHSTKNGAGIPTGHAHIQDFTSFRGDDLLETLTTDPHAPPGPLGRWVEHRRHEKEQRAIEQAEQDDAEMDAVLERLHQSSLGELSRSDRDLLKRVSQRLRDRDTRPLS